MPEAKDDGQSTEAASPAIRPCRHFARGFCFYGNSCRQSHDTMILAEEGDALKQSLQLQHQREAADAALRACEETIKSLHRDGAPHEDIIAAVSELSNLKEARRRIARPKRRTAHKSERAGVFRRFLLKTFGAEALRSGRGVIDVAGGHGSLSFELLNVDGVPCTIVDPRRVEQGFRQMQRKWLTLAKRPWSGLESDAFTVAALAADAADAADASSADARGPAYSSSMARALEARRVHLDWKAACEVRTECEPPRHWRLMWHPDLFGRDVFDVSLPTEAALSELAGRIERLEQQARAIEWTSKGLSKGLVCEATDEVDGAAEGCGAYAPVSAAEVICPGLTECTHTHARTHAFHCSLLSALTMCVCVCVWYGRRGPHSRHALWWQDYTLTEQPRGSSTLHCATTSRLPSCRAASARQRRR